MVNSSSHDRWLCDAPHENQNRLDGKMAWYTRIVSYVRGGNRFWGAFIVSVGLEVCARVAPRYFAVLSYPVLFEFCERNPKWSGVATLRHTIYLDIFFQ